jgi:hypothetical protein
MARGEKLYKALLLNSDISVKGCKVKGQKYFLEKRNELMFYRLYFYTRIKGKRYEDVLDILEKEFFLTKSSIVQYLQKHPNYIKAIGDEAPTQKKLARKFDFFNWK